MNETFDCEGATPDVLAAHNLAWQALTNVLGDDPIAAWSLKVMQHVYVPEGPGQRSCVKFHAQFSRNAEFEPDEVLV